MSKETDPPAKSGHDKAKELAGMIASQTAAAVAKALRPDGDTAFDRRVKELEQQFEPPAADPGAPDAHSILKMALGATKEGTMTPTETIHDPHYRIRVKNPSERFSAQRPTAKHFRTGEPIVHEGRQIDGLSDRQKADRRVFLKYKCAAAGLGPALTEFEDAYLSDMCANRKWLKPEFGNPDNDEFVRVDGGITKALLQDGTSGGQYMIPEDWDTEAIIQAILMSEVLPFVTIKDVNRSVVNAASLAHPDVVWGTAEGGAQSVFNTASMVGQQQTTIYPVATFLTEGKDWLADNAFDVQSELSQVMNESLARSLDQKVMTGNGTSEPEGIFSQSGTVDITFTTPTTGPYLVTDEINLAFGIAKPYRVPAMRPRYAMTDSAYKRFRSIATGVTGDTRLVNGMAVNDYSLLGWGVSILTSGNTYGITNDQLCFAAFSRYRLYRRAGFVVNVETRGDTLTRANLALIYGRGRFGGVLADPSAAACATSGIP